MEQYLPHTETRWAGEQGAQETSRTLLGAVFFVLKGRSVCLLYGKVHEESKALKTTMCSHLGSKV